MVEQFLYGWSAIGLQNRTGFQICAASAGLGTPQSERFLRIQAYLRYLPPSNSIVDRTRRGGPVSLALFDAGGERVLLHATPLALNVQGRSGTCVIHGLVGLARDFAARDAISLWGSRFWRTSLDGLSADALELPTVTEGELLAARSVVDWVDKPTLGQYLPFLIQAVLSSPASRRVYIVSSSEQAASLIFALVSCLPSSLAHSLTFSTYEEDIVGRPLRIVATQFESDRIDLPEEYYRGDGVALNCLTGRRSELPDSLLKPFAAYATECLVAGNSDDLRHLLQIADQLQVSDGELLMLLYRSVRAAPWAMTLTSLQLDKVLSQSLLASELLDRADVRSSLIQCVTTDQAWWSQRGRHLVKGLYGEAKAHAPELAKRLTQLSKEAIEEAAKAVEGGDTRTADALTYELAVFASGAAFPKVAAEVFHEGSVPALSSLSVAEAWPVRGWILQLAKAGALDLPKVRPWLRVPWSDVDRLIALDLPAEWKSDAVSVALLNRMNEPLSSEDWQIVSRHRSLFQQAVAGLLSAPEARAGIPGHGGQGYGGRLNKLAFVKWWVDCGACDPHFLDSLFQVTDLEGPEVAGLLESGGVTFFKRLRGTASPQPLIRRYLMDATARGRLDDSAKRLLKDLTNSEGLNGLDSNTIRAITGWLSLDGYIDHAKVDERSLYPLVLAIRECIPIAKSTPEIMTWRRLLVSTLASVIRTSSELVSVLGMLGDDLAGNRWNLYGALLDSVAGSRKGAEARQVVCEYLRVAFGYYHNHRPGEAADQAIDRLLRRALGE